MFTQRISMDCMKWRYEKYLKDELLKMGYSEGDLYNWFGDNNYITNYYRSNEYIGNINKVGIDKDNRLYLGKFNAPLFLALAAMTCKVEGNYGEYIIGLYTGRLYKMKEGERILPKHKLIRKATKEEIMERFGEKEFKLVDKSDIVPKDYLGVVPEEGKYYHCKLKNGGKWVFIAGGHRSGKTKHICAINLDTLFCDENNIIANDSDVVKIRPATDSEKEKLDFELAKSGIYFDQDKCEMRPINEKNTNHNTHKNTNDESDAINLLKSKGYKILKPTTWEEV